MVYSTVNFTVKLPHDEEELEKESWDPFDDYLDLRK